VSVPEWVLLAFAGWTLLLLTATVGVYRWGLVFMRRAKIADFRADDVRGADWYRRAMRAHANCIENLPVYAAIVFLLSVRGLTSSVLDLLAIALLVGRILQSTIHVALPETSFSVAVRFSFFSVQIASMLTMGIMVAAA
jgi:uncharacterized MAPEG superfamily protein